MEIVPGVHQIEGLLPWSANVFLLVDERLVLVDTGGRGSAGAIERYIRRIGRSPIELDLVMLTHYHIDHTGSLPELRERHHPRVAIHEAEVAYLQGELPDDSLQVGGPARAAFGLVRPLFGVRPVPVDLALRDGSVLDVLGGVRVVHTPGHTPGSICLYVPARKLALVGDALANKRWGLKLPTPLFTVDMGMARRSVAKLATLDLETVGFSHGAPLIRDGGRRIREFLRRSAC